MDYELVLVEHPAYLHATAKGRRNADNAFRFLKEAGDACVNSGRANLLLEMAFTGPQLDMSKIFEVVKARSAAGSRLRKIAYVDAARDNPGRPRFAETVARNRGVNARLFDDIASAISWLEEEEAP
jgi:chromosome condensin MukBEF MukE localization factor